MKVIARRLSFLLLWVVALPAQADVLKKEAELDKSAAATLLNFARTAKTQKVETRAKQAYDLVIKSYDADNATARQALGFKKDKGQWVEGPKDKQPRWEDKANNDQRYRVVDEWYKTSRKLGELHRGLGLELQKGEDLKRSAEHLERAVYYNPLDKEAHLALGHVEWNGFFGTEEDVAFVKRMKEIETKALELARKEYPVDAVPAGELPEELAKLNLEFHGSKSAHFKVWTRGTQENADNCVKWAERGLEFLEYLVGPAVAKKTGIGKRGLPFAWIAYLWTARERDDFLQKNPHVYDGKTIEQAKSFVNNAWTRPEGAVQVSTWLTPAQMHDNLITNVVHYGLGANLNAALTEGLQNAATWCLMSTSIGQFGALPEGTMGRDALRLPESTNWWLRKLRDDAIAGADWPLNQVPRERLSNFRNDVRIKSWSFMTWVVARYPETWFEFFAKVPADKIPFPEEVDKVCKETLGKDLTVVEAEWREWARGESGVAAATGYGPPLLPEKPNKEELAVLERMNQCRGTALAYAIAEGKKDLRDGSIVALPPVDLDAEASLACEDHAKYLTKWPTEHLKWPEAHEENPALAGFSPRGMRAGMRSVIVFLNGNGGLDFARDSVDGWIGTVYHRFPLLEHNIHRFGYSYVYDNGWSIAVLDMGSLEEPYNPVVAPRLVAWPPPGMKDVPRQFHGIEHPNPLDDQPENVRDNTALGYPVSLQLQREFAQQLTGSSITLYEVKNSKGKVPDKHLVDPGQAAFREWTARRGDSVPTWNHTPAEPLQKRMDLRDVVFAIPKAHLASKTTYQVEVLLKLDNEIFFVWEFTTGSQMQGLKF